LARVSMKPAIPEPFWLDVAVPWHVTLTDPVSVTGMLALERARPCAAAY
jgi:hypothetical protein